MRYMHSYWCSRYTLCEHLFNLAFLCVREPTSRRGGCPMGIGRSGPSMPARRVGWGPGPARIWGRGGAVPIMFCPRTPAGLGSRGGGNPLVRLRLGGTTRWCTCACGGRTLTSFAPEPPHVYY